MSAILQMLNSCMVLMATIFNSADIEFSIIGESCIGQCYYISFLKTGAIFIDISLQQYQMVSVA